MAKQAQVGQNPWRLTQGPNTSGKDASHQNREAIDIGGANPGGAGAVDKWVNPKTGCSWRVMQVQQGGDHFVYFETTEPVAYADGSGVGYGTLALAHQNAVTHKVGQIIAPGELMYTEGNFTGGRVSSMLAHIHVQAGKGKFAGPYGPYPYKLPNECPVQALLTVPDGVTISDGKGLKWVRASAIATTETNQSQQTEDDDVKLRLYGPMDETARTSQLIENKRERRMGKDANGNRIMIGPLSAHEVTSDTISATVDRLEKEGKFVPGTYLEVSDT